MKKSMADVNETGDWNLDFDLNGFGAQGARRRDELLGNWKIAVNT